MTTTTTTTPDSAAPAAPPAATRRYYSVVFGDGNAVSMGVGETEEAAWKDALEHGGTRPALEKEGYRAIPISEATYLRIFAGDIYDIEALS